MARAGRRWLGDAGAVAVALAGPALLTALLTCTGSRERDYIFLYVGLVAVMGV